MWIAKHGSRWAIVGGCPLQTIVPSLKTKAQAESIIGEIKSYQDYNGTDHMGNKINGFTVGARYGYFAVDEDAREGMNQTAIARVVASNLTRKAAVALAEVLNETVKG